MTIFVCILNTYTFIKKTVCYIMLALGMAAALQPSRTSAASWQYAACAQLLASNDIGIGLIATPVKTVASNVEHIDASALSEDVCSYVDGSIGDFRKVGFFDSLADDIKGFFQNILSCVADMFSRVL